VFNILCQLGAVKAIGGKDGLLTPLIKQINRSGITSRDGYTLIRGQVITAKSLHITKMYQTSLRQIFTNLHEVFFKDLAKELVA
jgi:hypothetical protein